MSTDLSPTTSPATGHSAPTPDDIEVTPLLGRLATLAERTTVANLPARQASSVPQRVLDILGICVRATTLASSVSALDYALDQGGTPRAHVVGSATALPAPTAAFVNGVLAHSLDYDDTHLPSILHPSASVVPAALAAAEAHGRSGSELIAAVAVGLEVAVRLGMAGYDRDSGRNVWFDKGLHATSICGAVGSAAAAGKLAGLDAAGIGHAMAIASSMGAGIIEANRTGGNVKRLHCGFAAQSGVAAAELAARGLTGPPTVFEGRFGFLSAHLGDGVHLHEVDTGLHPEDPSQHDWCVADIFYKPYPANHYTHCGIDAAISLREGGLRAEDVARAHLGVATATVRTIGEPLGLKQRPTTGYQAQFSGPYTVAAALLGGRGLGLGLGDFTDELACDPRRRELMARITVGGDPRCDAVYPHQFPAVLTVVTHGGDELVAEVMANRGGPLNPLTTAELARKFTDNTDGLLPAADSTEVASTTVGLAGLDDVSAVLRPLARPLP